MAGALDFYTAGLDPLKQAFGAVNKRALESNMPGMKPEGALEGWYDSLPMMDRQFYQDMLANLPDAARGLSAQTLGWPVDLATLAMRPLGYKTPTPVGSTDWWGQKMGADVHGLPYQITSMLPTDAGDIARGAGLLSAKYGPEMLGLLGMTAYHGSPHKFAPTEKNPLGEFDPSKINTGQKAQSYGYGFYLAQHPGTGKTYVPAMKEQDHIIKHAKNISGGDKEAAREIVRRWAAAGPKKRPYKFFNNEQYSDAADQFDYLWDNQSGYLYTVDLPDEQIAKMLDWDKPLSEQPDAIQTAVKAAMDEAGVGAYFNPFLRGEKAYIGIADRMTNPKVSALLNRYGIPGIKYFDEGSRAAKEGTRNFVVFDPSILNILERN